MNIMNNFSERDTASILELLLSQIIQEDSLFWQPNNKGTFMVKFAYKLAWNSYIKAKI